MPKEEYILGHSSPRVAVVASVHGDELIGKRVIGELRKLRLRRGTLGLFIAHPVAVKKKKRFISEDLNRVFPGKQSGNTEERIAYALTKKLKRFDVVIDLHGTNSQIDSLVIVTKFTPSTKKLLRFTPVKEVAFIPKKVFGGKELITHCRLGISLEYGPDKSARRYKTALRHTTVILKNLGLLRGRKILLPQKELYRVNGSYFVPDRFIQERSLRDFKLIKKGYEIGRVDRKTILSSQSFYPLFIGKGRYPKTLALMAEKKTIVV